MAKRGKTPWGKEEMDVAFNQVLKLPKSKTKTRLLKKIYKARFE